MNDKPRLVYSTLHGDLRKTPSQSKPAQKTSTKITCQVEKRARGKEVTVIRGLNLSHNELNLLLVQWKKCCATGGTIKENTLEFQGNHYQRILLLLAERFPNNH